MSEVGRANQRRGNGGSRCLVIANPVAGGASPEMLERVVKECGRHVEVTAVEVTARAGDATRLVTAALATADLDDRPEIVVAVGGDGTVREVAEALAGATARQRRAQPPDGAADGGPVLLIVPAGTGNSCHRSLWTDRPWTDVVEAALGERQARIRRLDVARLVEDRRAVLLGASSGFIAEVTAAARSFQHVVGRERYHRAMDAVWADFRPYPGRVLLDGEVIHEGLTGMATVGGARHRVGAFEVLPLSILDDGLLDVCIVDGDVTDDERAELAMHVMSGTHLGRPGVTYKQGRRVTIERTDGEPLCFEHDGDVWQSRHTAQLEVVPAAVAVLAPVQPVAG